MYNKGLLHRKSSLYSLDFNLVSEFKKVLIEPLNYEYHINQIIPQGALNTNLNLIWNTSKICILLALAV